MRPAGLQDSFGCYVSRPYNYLEIARYTSEAVPWNKDASMAGPGRTVLQPSAGPQTESSEFFVLQRSISLWVVYGSLRTVATCAHSVFDKSHLPGPTVQLTNQRQTSNIKQPCECVATISCVATSGAGFPAPSCAHGQIGRHDGSSVTLAIPGMNLTNSRAAIKKNV